MRDTSQPMGELAERVRRFTDRAGDIGQFRPTALDDLVAVQYRTPTPQNATVYDPAVCLTLQGAKELVLNDRRIPCQQGSAVIVSHDIPLASRITEASHEKPYLALTFHLDSNVLRSLIDDLGDEETDEPISASIQAGAADDELLDAVRRLFSLNDRPQDAAALAPLISREIHYRLLTADHGAALRRLVHRNGQAARISAAIAQIREDLSHPVSVPELARRAHMSVSTFHYHFKAITETTPLQYQKQLRLIEARRLLIESGQSVQQAAAAVGYRSATQFSREYSRTFGVRPRDAKIETAISLPAT